MGSDMGKGMEEGRLIDRRNWVGKIQALLMLGLVVPAKLG